MGDGLQVRGAEVVEPEGRAEALEILAGPQGVAQRGLIPLDGQGNERGPRVGRTPHASRRIAYLQAPPVEDLAIFNHGPFGKNQPPAAVQNIARDGRIFLGIIGGQAPKAQQVCPHACVRKEHGIRQDPHQDPRLPIEHIGNHKRFQPGKVIRDNDAPATGKLRAQAMQAEVHAEMPLQAPQQKPRDRMVPLIDRGEWGEWRWGFHRATTLRATAQDGYAEEKALHRGGAILPCLLGYRGSPPQPLRGLLTAPSRGAAPRHHASTAVRPATARRVGGRPDAPARHPGWPSASDALTSGQRAGGVCSQWGGPQLHADLIAVTTEACGLHERPLAPLRTPSIAARFTSTTSGGASTPYRRASAARRPTRTPS